MPFDFIHLTTEEFCFLVVDDSGDTMLRTIVGYANCGWSGGNVTLEASDPYGTDVWTLTEYIPNEGGVRWMGTHSGSSPEGVYSREAGTDESETYLVSVAHGASVVSPFTCVPNTSTIYNYYYVDRIGDCALIDIEDVKAQCNITVTTYDDLLSKFIGYASKAVKSYCNNPFCLTEYRERYDGIGDWRLVLNQTPIVRIHEVVIDVDGPMPQRFDGDQFVVNRKTGEVQFKPLVSNYFNEGFQNIYVKYVAGYSNIPSDVRYVTAEIVQRLYNKIGVDLTMLRERIGDYEYIRAALNMITPEQKAILDHYKHWAI